MKFILTLHTSTEWDSTGRIKGQTDIPLNSQGKEEAFQLGNLLLNLGVTMIISSDLKRAKETAEIIDSFLKRGVQSDKRLRECSFGKLEGLTRQQAIEQYGPTILEQWDDQFANYDFRTFGGECHKDVFKRHMELVNSFLETNTHDVILLIGHGRGLATLLSGLGYSPDLKRGEYKIIDFTQQKSQ